MLPLIALAGKQIKKLLARSFSPGMLYSKNFYLILTKIKILKDDIFTTLCIGREIINLPWRTVIDQHLVKADRLHLIFLKVSHSFFGVYVALGKLLHSGEHGVVILFPCLSRFKKGEGLA